MVMLVSKDHYPPSSRHVLQNCHWCHRARNDRHKVPPICPAVARAIPFVVKRRSVLDPPFVTRLIFLLSDLQSLLHEVAGDVELAATRISEGMPLFWCLSSALTLRRPCRAVGRSNAQKGQEGHPYLQGLVFLFARRLPWRTWRLARRSWRIHTRRRRSSRSWRRQSPRPRPHQRPLCRRPRTLSHPQRQRLGGRPPRHGQGPRLCQRMAHRVV
jgi:hypothetical protein